MSFSYSAFIENTEEMFEWMVNAGGHTSEIPFNQQKRYLVAYKNGAINQLSELFVRKLALLRKDFIDCRNNPELFKAITALRDDNNMNQFFVADVNIMYHLAFPDGEPLFGDIDMGEFFLMDKAMSCADYMGDNQAELAHKATLEELIEHFKK